MELKSAYIKGNKMEKPTVWVRYKWSRFNIIITIIIVHKLTLIPLNIKWKKKKIKKYDIVKSASREAFL